MMHAWRFSHQLLGDIWALKKALFCRNNCLPFLFLPILCPFYWEGGLVPPTLMTT